MNEYEIHITCTKVSDGGTNEHHYFMQYVNANTAAEAKRLKKAELKADGFHNIKMEALKV